MIPKIIHYCWLSDDPCPSLVRRCIASWLKKLPEWEVRLWDKSCLDEIDVPWVHEAYKAKVYSHAADYIRLYAVYQYGGFYFDSDVEVLKDFTPLTVNSYVLGWESGTDNIEAATFGAEAGNLYLKQCLDKYATRHFVKSDGTYDYQFTVPVLMKDYLSSPITINSVDDFNAESQNMQILPVRFFSPKNHASGKMTDLSADTFSIHHFRLSWMPLHAKLALYTYRYFGNGVYTKAINLYKRLRVNNKQQK